MFLNQFNYTQRKFFLGFAEKMLLVDEGIIDAKEEKYLRTICNEMELSRNDGLPFDFSNITEVFSEAFERKIFLLEAIALALSNDEYHKNEKDLIQRISNSFSIDLNETEEAENLIQGYFSNQTKLMDFIEG